MTRRQLAAENARLRRELDAERRMKFLRDADHDIRSYYRERSLRRAIERLC